MSYNSPYVNKRDTHIKRSLITLFFGLFLILSPTVTAHIERVNALEQQRQAEIVQLANEKAEEERQAKIAEEKRIAAEKKAKAEAKRKAEEKRKAERARLARLEAARKAEEARQAELAAQRAEAPQTAPTPVSYSGSHEDWLRAAGIPSGVWGCADALIMRESGWRVNATNPSSGAYGIPQSLPGSKMASHGSDWRTNPVTQIRWMNDYVNDRYGGWCQADSFQRANNWY